MASTHHTNLNTPLVFSATSSSSSLGYANATEASVIRNKGTFLFDGHCETHFVRNLEFLLQDTGIETPGESSKRQDTLIVALPPVNRLQRVSLADLIFDRFKFDRLLFVPRGACALYCFGLTTGIVLDYWSPNGSVIGCQLFDEGHTREGHGVFRLHKDVINPYTNYVIDKYTGSIKQLLNCVTPPTKSRGGGGGTSGGGGGAGGGGGDDGWEFPIVVNNALPAIAHGAVDRSVVDVWGGREDYCWHGASVLGSLLQPEAYVTRLEYEDYGEGILDRKC